MKTYRVKLIIEQEGKKAACIGKPYIKAASEQEALETAREEGTQAYGRICAMIGRRNETTRIWAELA